MSRYWNVKLERLVFTLALLVISCFLRFETAPYWSAPESEYYVDGSPVLSTVDGYYYLSLAQRLSQEKYGEIDELRNVPQQNSLPFPPPALSLLTQLLSSVTGQPLLNVAAYMPVFISLLTYIPLFFLLRLYIDETGAWLACLLLACSSTFVNRTSFGWYDTDMLQLFFLLLTIYLGLMIAKSEREIYRFYGLAWFVCVGCWMAWWDQAKPIVILISFAGLITALLSAKLQGAKYLLEKLAASTICVIVLLILFDVNVGQILSSLLRHIQYLFKIDTKNLPAMGVTIAEQGVPSVFEVINSGFVGWLGFLLVLIALVALFLRNKVIFLDFSVLISLGLLGFMGNRYLVYTAAFSSVFIIYALYELARIKRHVVFRYAYVVTTILILQAMSRALENFALPIYNAGLIEGLTKMKETTDKSSVIWAWWDLGYPINYWSERATINDGQTHTSELNFYNALPLISNNENFSYFFIKFFIAHGMEGIDTIRNEIEGDQSMLKSFLEQLYENGMPGAEHVLSEQMGKNKFSQKSKEEWLAFFFPERTRDIFLYLDQSTWGVTETIGNSVWSRNISHGPKLHLPLFNLQEKDNKLYAQNGIEIDLDAALLVLNSKHIVISPLNRRSRIANGNPPIQIPFSRYRWVSDEGSSELSNNYDSDKMLIWNQNTGHGAFSSAEFADTMIYRLFLQEQESKHFTKVAGKNLVYQIWRLN